MRVAPTRPVDIILRDRSRDKRRATSCTRARVEEHRTDGALLRKTKEKSALLIASRRPEAREENRRQMSGEPPNGETHLEPMAENVTESPPVEIITTDQIIETSTIESATPVGVAETNNGATNDFGGGASGRPPIYLRHRCMRLVRTDRIDCDGEAHAILYPDLYTTRLAEAVECVTCKSRVTTRQILTHSPHRDFLPKNLSRSELVKKCSEFGNDEAMRCRRNGRWRTCLVLHSNMPSSAEREAYEYVKNLFFREVQNKADARKGILPGDKRKGKKRKHSGDHVADDNEMNFFLEGSVVVENEDQPAVPEILHSELIPRFFAVRGVGFFFFDV